MIRHMRLILALPLVAIAAALIFVSLPPQEASARHEIELAEGLARDFQFFDLAIEILEREAARGDVDQNYLNQVYLMEMRIYQTWARLERQAGNTERANELTGLARDAQDNIRETGTGGITVLGAEMERAAALVRGAEIAEDPNEANQMRDEAAGIYETCAEAFLTRKNQLYERWFRGDFEETSAEALQLRNAWYYYCKCLYELGKLGRNRSTNFETCLEELMELQFEFEGSFVYLYASLLKGDVLVEDQQYGRASTEYETIRALPVRPEGITTSEQQQTFDDLRQQAYYKLASCYLKAAQASAGNSMYQRVVQIVDDMFMDYPGREGDYYMKLSRLLKAEAMIRLGADPRQIIEELEAFKVDPEQFFRQKYFKMLASIGRYPELSLDVRLECGRGAFEAQDFVSAASIYQLIISNLTDQEKFEAYGPEAYWKLGESLSEQWRFAESALVFYHAAARFEYFFPDPRFQGEGDLPAHMMQEPVFWDAPYRENVRQFPLTLIKEADKNLNQWSPDGTLVNRNQCLEGSIAEVINDDLRDLLSHLEQLIGDPAQVMESIYLETWESYYAPQQSGMDQNTADMMPAISRFARINSYARPAWFFEAMRLAAYLMDYEYYRRNPEDGRPMEHPADPFPENNQDEREPRRGEDFYVWQQEEVASRFNNIPANHQQNLYESLEKILSPEVQEDLILLYWYKAQYFWLRYIYGVMNEMAAGMLSIDPEAFDGNIGQALGVLCAHLRQTIENASTPQEALFSRTLGRDLTKAVWSVGNLIRKNPWSSPTGHLSQGPEARQTNIGQIHRALDLWSGFADNFAFAYQDPNDEEQNAALRGDFEEYLSNLIYLRFYMHIRVGDSNAAEQDLRSFDLNFPPGVVDSDDPDAVAAAAERAERRQEFVRRLASSYENRNFLQKGQYLNALQELLPLVGRLKSEDAVALPEIRDTVQEKAIYLWIKRVGTANIVCPKEEDLINELARLRVLQQANLEFLTEDGDPDFEMMWEWVDEHPEVIEGLPRYPENLPTFFGGDRDAAVREAFNLSDTASLHWDRDRLLAGLLASDGSDRRVSLPDVNVFAEEATQDLRTLAQEDKYDEMLAYAAQYNVDLNLPSSLYADERPVIEHLAAYLRGEEPLPGSAGMNHEMEQTYHPQIMQMYAGFLRRVFSERFAIAGLLESVTNAYRAELVLLEEQALSYWYDYWEIQRAEDPEQFEARDYYRNGRRLFGAEMWSEALQWLTPVWENYRNRFEENDGTPFPIDLNNRDQRLEVTLRYYFGRCHYELALREGGYNPTSEHWQKAFEHFERLYAFASERNQARQQGHTSAIAWEQKLDEYYYLILYSYAELQNLKAEYNRDRGNLEEAAEAWDWARGIQGLLHAQSPNHSPDQREGTVQYCIICLKVGRMMPETDTGRQHLSDAMDVFNGLYRGRNPETVVLWDDASRDAQMDALYLECLQLLGRTPPWE